MKYLNYCFTVALFLVSVATFSQDNLIKHDGTIIKAKILEVGSTQIQYKNIDNIDGTTYTVEKHEVFMIQYENGSSDLFEQEKNTKKEETEINAEKKIRKEPNVRITIGWGAFQTYAGDYPGWINPSLGFDIRQERRAWGSLSFGARFGSYNLDAYYTNMRIPFGVGGNVNYYLPLKSRFFMPYISSIAGIGMHQTTSRFGKEIIGSDIHSDYYYYYEDEELEWNTSIGFFGGGGIGADFMFARNFGMYLEMGFFSNALVNAGLSIKF